MLDSYDFTRSLVAGLEACAVCGENVGDPDHINVNEPCAEVFLKRRTDYAEAEAVVIVHAGCFDDQIMEIA